MELDSIRQQYGAALARYSKLKNTPRLFTSVFQSELVLLIGAYPCFLPAYLELLEEFEGSRRVKEYAQLLRLASNSLQDLIARNFFTRDLIRHLSFTEILLFRNLFDRIKTLRTPFSIGAVARLFQFFTVERAIVERYRTVRPEVSATHLTLLQEYDVLPMAQELLGKDIYWYAAVARQEFIYNHQHTETIILRALHHKNEVIMPIDGPHESRVTTIGSCFERTLSFVERYAYEHAMGLGRVVLVRLAPRKMAYTHFDSEVYLRGRDRYHLVVQSSGRNILNSGNDYAIVKPGELWFFDNKALHKSYNDSLEWRTHLIFDAYPLEKLKNPSHSTMELRKQHA